MYRRNSSLIWADQVKEFSSDIFRRYFKTANTFVSGFAQIFQNKDRVSR